MFLAMQVLEISAGGRGFPLVAIIHISLHHQVCDFNSNLRCVGKLVLEYIL